MKYLTADFGSTYTKLAAIDSDRGKIIGTASAFTTANTDIMEGFRDAMRQLESRVGPFAHDQLLCCSSAAGGLKMVALGLVPELTAKAARTAAASAGAKVVRTFSFEISKSEQEEIKAINPDLVLLCGGTDGGNKEVIIANARKLGEIESNFSIVVAGNKSAADEVDDILSKSNKEYRITENVMPQFNQLNIEPARQEITKIFIDRIIHAKGLGAVQEMASSKVIPTPRAVMNGCELLSRGTEQTEGIGELMAIDIGGATTDVYSMSDGTPTLSNVLVKGLPEPYAKRSVEGDLGMRYGLGSLIEAANMQKISRAAGIPGEEIKRWASDCMESPQLLATPESREQSMEEALAGEAARIATERHCGTWETVYTPLGQVFALTGKDLSDVPLVIGIGGVIVNSNRPEHILEGVKVENNAHEFAKPKSPRFRVDKRYIFGAMGLLAEVDEELALKLLKKEFL